MIPVFLNVIFYNTILRQFLAYRIYLYNYIYIIYIIMIVIFQLLIICFYYIYIYIANVFFKATEWLDQQSSSQQFLKGFNHR